MPGRTVNKSQRVRILLLIIYIDVVVLHSYCSAIEEVKKPLVIPLKDNQKNLLDRIREFKKREQQPTEDTRPDSELTPDELVARQLLKGIYGL